MHLKRKFLNIHYYYNNSIKEFSLTRFLKMEGSSALTEELGTLSAIYGEDLSGDGLHYKVSCQ